MPTGDAERIRSYLIDQVKSARLRGDKTIIFRSGNIHKVLGLINSYRNVCQVMKGPMFREAAGVRIARYIASPSSGEGASLEIEFRIL